jgi:hypothetical protein
MSRPRKPVLLSLCFSLAITAGLQASDGDAGPDQYLCGTQAILGASPLTPGETGAWAVVSGAATFSPANSPSSIVSGLSIGENILQWTVFINGFPASSDQVTITVYDPGAPAANAGPDVLTCIDEPTVVLQAAPVVYPILGNWTVTTGSATIASPSNAQTAVTCAGLGSVTLLWTVYNGPCGVTSDQVMIQVEDCQTGLGEHLNGSAVLRFDEAQRLVRIADAPGGSAVLLVDAVGRIIATANTDDTGALGLSVEGFAVGWYAVRLQGAGRAQLLRFLLAR